MKTLSLAVLAVMSASTGGAQVPLTLDTSFRATRFVNSGFMDVLPLDDGSVLATGYMISIDQCCSGIPYSFFRLLPNGDLDESWTTNGGYGPINPSGDYYYLNIDGFPLRYFQSTGELDPTFEPLFENDDHPGLNNGNGGDIFVQADGKVLCTGDHLIVEQWGQNAPGWYSLLQVNTDGILDSTFDYRQTNGVIWTLEPTTQGRLLVSGVYSTYEGQPAGRILRIWPDGSLDTTFHTDIIKGYASVLEELPDGRILAGGQFVFPNEPDTMHLIRLLPNGTLDSTFNNHTEYNHLPQWSFGDFSHSLRAILPLPDGTMMVGGDFTHINGQLRRGVALLDTAGNLLNTAFTGEGCGLWHDFNSTSMYSGLTDISLAPDGSIFVCGFFKGFDDGLVSDTSMTFIAKLHGLSVGIHETAATQKRGSLLVLPNPANTQVSFRYRLLEPVKEGYIRLVDALGHEVMRLPLHDAHGESMLDTRHFANGNYTAQLINADLPVASQKLILQ
ncbi:MAG: hypothetical protein K8H89_10265 [Flavobacteriales bacterium]|jgi:uncharacterized delta-60 repeat protein|nr:hypothetical protein [Flavobacteriales bacterium]